MLVLWQVQTPSLGHNDLTSSEIDTKISNVPGFRVNSHDQSCREAVRGPEQVRFKRWKVNCLSGSRPQSASDVIASVIHTKRVTLAHRPLCKRLGNCRKGLDHAIIYPVTHQTVPQEARSKEAGHAEEPAASLASRRGPATIEDPGR